MDFDKFGIPIREYKLCGPELNWDLDGKPKANNPRLIKNAYRRHPEVATVYRGPVSRWRMTIVKRKEHEAATSSKVI
jgi:hypothetical protein